MERKISIVRVRLWSPSKRYLLVEMGRKGKDGVVSWKAQMPAAKQLKDEAIPETIQRMLTHRLGLHEHDVDWKHSLVWEHMQFLDNSRSFPGVTNNTNVS